MKAFFQNGQLTLEPEDIEEMHFIATMGEQLAWGENPPKMSCPVRLHGSQLCGPEFSSFTFARPLKLR